MSVRARASWFWAFQQDRYLGFRPRPDVTLRLAGGNLIDTSSAGFRDAEVPVVAPKPRRLLVCVGESSTWGTGASDRQHTWPRRLETHLSRISSEPFATLNAGTPAYTMMENAELIGLRLLKYAPEAILYMGFRNDWYLYAASLDSSVDLNFAPRELAALPDSWFHRTLMSSSLAALVVSRLGKRTPLDGQGVTMPRRQELTPRGEATFRDRIATIDLLCRRHGVRLLWVDQPISRTQVAPADWTGLERLRAVLHDELRRLKVPLLEAHARYDHRAAPMLDGVHFSDAGNDQLAGVLAPQVLQALAESVGAAPAGAIP